jgi:hypothetical protein
MRVARKAQAAQFAANVLELLFSGLFEPHYLKGRPKWATSFYVGKAPAPGRSIA